MSVALRASKWAYRIPFGFQWVWATPILIGVMSVPVTLVAHPS
jgi:hypothetical protein